MEPLVHFVDRQHFDFLAALKNDRSSCLAEQVDAVRRADGRGGEVEDPGQAFFQVVLLSINGAETRKETLVFQQIKFVAPEHWAWHVGRAASE